LTNDILLLSLITNAVLFWKLANRNRMLAQWTAIRKKGNG